VADSHGAKGCFSSNVWIGAGKDGFDIWEQIARHFYRGDIAESTKGETDNVLVGMFEVTEYVLASSRRSDSGREAVLRQGICYEGQDFLVLVEQQHGA
jgi:hypothetical protein